MAAKPFLKKGLRKTIGPGSNTKVWSDPWIPDIPTRPAKALHSSTSRDPNLSVNTLIGRESREWDLTLLIDLFRPEDIPLILGLRPCCTSIPNGYAWSYTNTGVYTVKSGYDLASKTKLSSRIPKVSKPSTTCLLSQVWKTRTSGKLRHFMWQALSECVATCQRLTYRHLGSDMTCRRCGALEEIINHLLFECPPALQVWAFKVYTQSNQHYKCEFPILANKKEIGLSDSQKDTFPWILWYI